MSEEEVEDLLAGVHDGMSSGLLALAGGWPAVIGLASLTTTDSPLPDEGLELPEQLYEFFADEVYRGARARRAGSGSGCSRPLRASTGSSPPSCSAPSGPSACAPRR